MSKKIGITTKAADRTVRVLHQNGNLVVAEGLARELGRISLAEALESGIHRLRSCSAVANDL